MLLLYMRWPVRVLAAGEKPAGTILTFVADQFDVPATAFDDYARHAETRRAHLANLMQPPAPRNILPLPELLDHARHIAPLGWGAYCSDR